MSWNLGIILSSDNKLALEDVLTRLHEESDDENYRVIYTMLEPSCLRLMRYKL